MWKQGSAEICFLSALWARASVPVCRYILHVRMPYMHPLYRGRCYFRNMLQVILNKR